MRHPIDFMWNYAKSKILSLIHKDGFEKYCVKLNRYAGKDVLNLNDCHNKIAYAVDNSIPFCVARLGATELYCASTFEFDLTSKQQNAMDQMEKWSGFFPNEKAFGDEFFKYITESLENVDMLAFWALRFEEYFIKKYMNKEVDCTFLYNIEPWRNLENPWSKSLKGKKVLVIHPFEESIRYQYGKRDLLFPGTEVLPKFELSTLKAVQTLAGTKDERFQTWFDALDWMYNQAMEKEFDVAIIGCGAYGLPLAARLKKAGKVAIHLGGATQLLFGIKGKRWDTQPDKEYVRKLYNEHWVYPSVQEKPKNANSVEGGCYW